MNRARCLALVPAVFVLLLGTSAPGQEDPSGDEAMKLSRQQIERYVAAINAHDAAAAAAEFAPDGDSVAIVGDQVLRRKGRAAIQENFARMFSESPGLKVKITPESVRMITDEVYVGEGRWEFTDSKAKGRYVAVRKKIGDQWRIVSSHLFSPQSPVGGQ